MIDVCNLCKETKELQRKCHVIPDFFYKESDLFHKHHNLVGIDLPTFLKTGKREILINKQKTGDYDLFKLCKDCDGNIIGSYESYASEFFFAENLSEEKRIRYREKDGILECLNIDYSKLKLMFLSILWRASLSDRPLFSQINLDENKKEELRKMILNGDPKKDTEFPIFFMNTLFDNSISKDYMLQPIPIKVANENGFMFGFGGMIVIYTFGIDGINDTFLKYRIQENGIFAQMNVPYGETWKLFSDWYKK